MKKLYAKTSFAHKKASKQAKSEEIHAFPSPIMAYRQTSNSGSVGADTATVNKTPKMSRAFSAPLREEIDSNLDRRSISPPLSLMSTQSFYSDEPTHYYYSIGDMEQINWQQEQRLRQQEWRRRRLTKTPVLSAPMTPFHQHAKMVLQLPKAVDVTPTNAASPIYEQPQIASSMTTNGFASLPHDLQRNVGCAASAKGEEAVSSINSMQQRLWQGNDTNNNNNKHDKCLLQHSQSMHMSRTKPATKLQNNNNNFYQHNEAELQNQHNHIYQKAEQLQMQQQQQQPQEEQRSTSKLQRYNSVKENFISRLKNGVAAMYTYVF